MGKDFEDFDKQPLLFGKPNEETFSQSLKSESYGTQFETGRNW